jgi:hypothetical protein
MPRIIPAPGGSGGSTFGIDNAQLGLWVPAGAPFVAQSALAITPNRMYVVRFVSPKSITISKICFCVAVLASVNDACDAGIFSGDGATLLGSAGSTLGKLNGALGLQTLNLQAPVSLAAGQIYYAAWAGAVGGTSVQTTQFVTRADMCLPFGTAPPNIEAAVKDPGIPIAAPMSVNAAGVGQGPILALQT